ncbi:Heterokaryon incompatibility protein HET [Aspergillus sclerotialis]|uniref:Heterokaryon incompatibility protein HET n=1 Tax=Aspergillus sclerotialis TaxID=2070753 RepID=A0A3A2ZMF8_9EURO|nr:Heterokaryon incompatibility protein HET [Aspergillus sclerotialis]
MASENISFNHRAVPSDGHHIRLLKFEDTVTNEPLRFSLRAYRLSDKIVYNALSYEWASPTADKRIIINNRPFLIRANLHSFLEILAGSEERNTLLFADAISINQEDVFERNAQVQRMRDVYRQAAKVLVWLGPRSAETDLIFDMCTEGRQDEVDIHGSTGEALDMVYQRSYWTRLWIIQELFFAREAIIFCGSKFVPWSSFLRLPTCVKGDFARGGFTGYDIALGSSPRGLYTREILGYLGRVGQDSIFGKTLDEVVIRFGRAQCLDVRDHVYGLLGLVRARREDSRGVEVKADYSATAAALFVRLLSNMPIPGRIFNLVFEVGLTHLGHIRHVNEFHACEWCKLWNERDSGAPFESVEPQQQEFQGKAISKFIEDPAQLSLAAHNCGPLLSLGPYNICLTATKVSEGDEVFLLEGTKIVLIRHQENRGQASGEIATGFTQGILAHTNGNAGDSISQAARILDSCLPSLPAPAEVRLENAHRRFPFRVIHEELTLRQILLSLTQTGQHSTYWDERL